MCVHSVEMCGVLTDVFALHNYFHIRNIDFEYMNTYISEFIKANSQQTIIIDRYLIAIYLTDWKYNIIKCSYKLILIVSIR